MSLGVRLHGQADHNAQERDDHGDADHVTVPEKSEAFLQRTRILKAAVLAARPYAGTVSAVHQSTALVAIGVYLSQAP